MFAEDGGATVEIKHAQGEDPDIAQLIQLPGKPKSHRIRRGFDVYLTGGSFIMGSDEGFFPEDGEGPTRQVSS
jgi:hypothetical protein